MTLRNMSRYISRLIHYHQQGGTKVAHSGSQKKRMLTGKKTVDIENEKEV